MKGEKHLKEKQSRKRMATLCSPSSLFLSSTKPLKPFSFQTKKSTFQLTRSVSITSVLSRTTETSSPALQNFWQWACDNGVISNKSPSVKLGTVPEGLGLIAEKSFSRNEVVVEVPKKFWINSDTVIASEIGKFCGGLKPWVSIALFLLREKTNKGSSWQSYLDILPDSTNSTIYCTGQKRSSLNYKDENSGASILTWRYGSTLMDYLYHLSRDLLGDSAGV